MIKISSRGSFIKTEAFLNSVSKRDILGYLERFGQNGVEALSAATPVDSGLAASSWGYIVERNKQVYSITWTNNDVEGGNAPVVILLQYGHGTGTGGYVQGRDFINPAIQPIFDQIAEEVWKAVTSA